MRIAWISILFFWVTSICDLTFSAQEVYSQKEREQFHNSIHQSCLDRQTRDEMNANLLPTVIDESCKCFAARTTANVFGSMEYQLALYRKDNAAAQRVISRFVSTEEATSTLISCLQLSIDQHGGWNKIKKEGPSGQLSTQIGLRDGYRSAFIAGGIPACKSTQNQMPENKNLSENVIEAYCECSMNYLADRVSPATVAELGQQKPSAIKYFEEPQKASGDFCRKKILGLKGQ